MEQLTTTSILRLFDTTKEQRASFAANVVAEIEQGNVNPLDIHLQFKAIEQISETVLKDVQYRSAVLTEAEKYGKKSTYRNAEISIREVGVKYDYSQCNDPVLSELMSQADEIGEKLKSRQKMLQTIPGEGMAVLIPDTGEMVTVYPPSKSSTTSVAVTLK